MIEKFKPPFDNNECFDIYGYVETIRGQRQFMVQVEEQYIFIYDAVLDAGIIYLCILRPVNFMVPNSGNWCVL